MEININDARRSSLCVNLADRYRWALLKLDLCSITAILRPRVLLIPARSKPTRDARDDFIYTRRKPAASPRRRGATREKKKKEQKRMKRRRRQRRRAFCRAPMHRKMQCNSFRILYPTAAPRCILFASYRMLVPSRCVACARPPDSSPWNDGNLDYFDLRSR